MRLAAVLVLTTAACAGCGGGDDNPDGPQADARVDASIDATQGCTGPQDFTGEMVDFDSTPLGFLGVHDALFTLRGNPGCTARTAPNGRFVMTLPAADAVVDIDAPADYLDGFVVVPRATITAPMATFSLRGLTDTRAISLSEEQGEVYDPTKATVMVYQAVDSAVLMLTGLNGAAVTTDDGTAWVVGSDASYIAFTNVEIGTGTQTLSGPGPTIGLGPVPVAAGQITYVTTLFALD